MSDKTGFIGELVGEIGKTAGSIVSEVISIPPQFLKDAAGQFNLPVSQEVAHAKRAVQPRIDYLSQQLRSIPRQEQRVQSPARTEQKAIESPGRNKKPNLLNMIRRPDRKDPKGASA